MLILLLSSCKKDPPVVYPDYLTGDTAVFSGTWDWIYSDHDYGHCDNFGFYELINPSNSGVNHQLIFSPNGILRHLRNDTIVRDYQLYFTDFYTTGSCQFGPTNNSFAIDLDNNKDNVLSGCLSEDSLFIFTGFLYDDFVNQCEDYSSYFVKQ